MAPEGALICTYMTMFFKEDTFCHMAVSLFQKSGTFQVVFANAYSPTYSGIDQSTSLTIKRESNPEPERLEHKVEGTMCTEMLMHAYFGNISNFTYRFILHWQQ